MSWASVGIAKFGHILRQAPQAIAVIKATAAGGPLAGAAALGAVSGHPSAGAGPTPGNAPAPAVQAAAQGAGHEAAAESAALVHGTSAPGPIVALGMTRVQLIIAGGVAFLMVMLFAVVFGGRRRD